MRELAEFVPELANSKEYLCSKFEDALTLEIQEKMSVSGGQSYKEIVQLALRAKSYLVKKCLKESFKKERDLDLCRDSHLKRALVLNILVIHLDPEPILLAPHKFYEPHSFLD